MPENVEVAINDLSGLSAKARLDVGINLQEIGPKSQSLLVSPPPSVQLNKQSNKQSNKQPPKIHCLSRALEYGTTENCWNK